jgi:hypothetical protein
MKRYTKSLLLSALICPVALQLSAQQSADPGQFMGHISASGITSSAIREAGAETGVQDVAETADIYDDKGNFVCTVSQLSDLNNISLKRGIYWVKSRNSGNKVLLRRIIVY